MAGKEPLKKDVMAENEALKQRLQDLESETDQLRESNQKLHIQISKPGAMEPMEEQIGQDGVAEIPTQMDIEEDFVIERPAAIMDVEAPGFDEKMAMEQFMREPVTVMVHETNEENPAPFFEVSVNGRREVFYRGKPKTVARMFVEGLARAKPVKFRNEEYTQQDGVRAVRWPTTTGLRYPFSVIEDKNPMGPNWLKSVLAQP